MGGLSYRKRLDRSGLYLISFNVKMDLTEICKVLRDFHRVEMECMFHLVVKS